MLWNQEIPSVFIDLPIRKHRVYKALHFNYEPGSGVGIKFCVVGVVIELLLSLIGVIFLAEKNNCGPFVRGFNNHVPMLSKFAKGNSVTKGLLSRNRLGVFVLCFAIYPLT